MPTSAINRQNKAVPKPWGIEKSNILAATATRGGGDVAIADFNKMNRLGPTLDVIFSKLFPAGFCWQLASMLTKADPSTSKFALTTGLGEAAGVLVGHVLYSFIKGGYDKSVLETAILLATGTLCSGSSWQPVVNALQSMDLPFYAGECIISP